ncbi:hypothetical protein [Oceanicola sp. D3]|uniref:hypothetical protein n=1 Tax=Oceanicola sp. D3 TaxID=2587163 RepID=UPI0020C7AA81|nr:hypothetical protein [Oceanicola sp. D3]
MGRPPITLSEAQTLEVETLAALLNQDQIADYFGICRNTFRAICERDAEVGARYKRGKAKAIAHVANGLLQKARSGDTTSSIFYLKTQAGWRETAELRHSVEERPLEALSDDELWGRLDETLVKLDGFRPRLVNRLPEPVTAEEPGA